MITSISECDTRFAAMRKIDYVEFARLCQTIVPLRNKFIVRFSFPPFEARKEVDEVGIALKHGHRLVATTVHPAAAHIRPNVGPATGSLAGGLVPAGHGD